MPTANSVSTGKKTKGRKRQIATDTLGCLLGVVVHRANLVDTTMGIWPAMIASCAYPTIKRFCADKGYCGTFIHDAYGLLHCPVDLSANIKTGKRWVVERSFAWLNNSHRLSKDYEIRIRTNSAEAMIKLYHIRTLLNRL